MSTIRVQTSAVPSPTPTTEDTRVALRDWLTVNDLVIGPGRCDPRGALPPAKEIRAFSSALAAAGFAGLSWPRAYGGHSLSAAHDTVIFEELVRSGRADHVGTVGLGMVGPALLAFGSEEQKQRFLPAILTGQHIFCQGFSESEAGSDLAGLRATAQRTDEGWVLNGHKLWSTGAPVADHCLVLARTGPAQEGRRNLICLLVDLRVPGVRVRPLRQLTGVARFGEVVFDDVSVRDDCVLGPADQGWRVAMTTLGHERGSFGVRLATELDHRYQTFLDMIQVRGLGDVPSVEATVGDLYVRVAGTKAAAQQVMERVAAGSAPGPEASLVKLTWSSVEQDLARAAVDLLGDGDDPDQVTWRHHLLRSRAATIEGGTSEVLRDVLAERVLGLPRTR